MKKRVDKILGYFLILLMAIMTINVLWGVITRYLVGTQASWTEELARFLLIWVGILGAAYASGQKLHLSIDLLKPKLGPSKKRNLTLFIDGLIILFVVMVMIIGGIRLIYVTNTLGQLSAALRIPMAYIYLVVPLSGLMVLFYKIDSIKDQVTSHKITLE